VRPTPIRLRTGLASLLAVSLVISGCSHVITRETPYYVDGPRQADPPQGWLPEGTGVWILGRDGTYVRVLTGTMINAWVRDWDVASAWGRSAEPAPKEPEAKKEPFILITPPE
jgi:hypothetical protein